MKKIIIGLAMLFSLGAYASPPVVKPNILQKFKISFPKAQNISWYTGTMKYEVKESDYAFTEGNFKYFEVSFLENEVQFKVYYTEEGKVFSTKKYYDKEEDLSPFILEKINEKYSGKSVKGITEVQDGSGLSYEVILQDFDGTLVFSQ